MIDVGSGPPLVLVPGVQGRWEWMRTAVEALSSRFRVLTFTLAGERAAEYPLDPRLGFDTFVLQVDRVLERARVERAFVCGVSWGGLIALRYAALRPDRVRGLMLVSALAPGFTPDPWIRFYIRAPRLLAPLFCAGAVRRAWPEIRTSLPGWRARARFALKEVRTIASAPMSPALMRQRVHLLEDVDFTESARRVIAPTLILTGEPALDRVVPVEHTLGYERILTRTETAQMRRTGHLGLITRPAEFASILASFAGRVDDSRPLQDSRRAAG
jgi:pimeloyl-ACP methyl ester carboxylesterase